MTTATTAEPSASPAAEQALAAAFDSKPNPARLRLFGATKQAHDALRMALKAGRALSLLVGHDGVGKSSLMQRLGEELGGREALSIYLPNSHMALDDVLRACCEGMGVPAAADTRHARLAAIARYAGEVNRRAIMFFVDNAHTYGNAALLDFAALSAFDTGTPVVYQVVLAGPPSLEEYLELNLQQVRGRVSAIVHMAPLDIEDVDAYVRFRLEAAGGGGSDILTPDLLNRIARKSYGVPGLINELCTYALTHPIEDVLARLEPDPPATEVEVEDGAEALKGQATERIEAPSSAEPLAAAAAADLAPAPEPVPPLEASPAAPAQARAAEPAPDIESPTEPVATVQPPDLTPSATAPTPAAAAAPIAIPEQATPTSDRVAVVSPPPEPEPSKSTVPAPNVEAAPPSVAKAAGQEIASSDHERGPIEEPATMLIDDTPSVETPPPVISAPSAAERPPALADVEAPKRRFSFRASESPSARKPQTYEEWRRIADEERRREGGADPRFEYVPLEPAQPAAPRVLIPPSADPVAQPGARPTAALDDADPGAVPWVAAVESALMRAAAKRAPDDGAAPATSGRAANPPQAAKPSSADDGKAKPAVDASSAESSAQKPAAKKRRFGFF